jgi:aryl-alcohol dehydrogenase-like predicted oxidoreductase
MPYGIANQTGQITRTEAKAMLQLASIGGIDTLDTAIAYGDSEACLGEAGVRRFRLVTKLPSLPDACSDAETWVHEQFAASLDRLDVGSVYGLLLHRSEQLLAANGKKLYRALQDLKAAGKVEKVGVSIYAPGELEAICKLYPIDLVQAPFNLVDRRLDTSGWLRRLKDDGVEVHTRSAFLQGLLLMPRSAMPSGFAPWNDLWECWHKWLLGHDASALQACLAFPLAFPEIDRVVVGADGVRQLGEIIASVSGALPVDLPDLRCEAENLINPSFWPR